jgi:protein SCO1/2
MKRLLLALAVAPMFANAQSLPFLVGGDYVLTNQNGDKHTQVDPDGRAQLLFFGYANCLQICSSVLPQMADITDELSADGHAIRPIMITVDPTVDTTNTLGPALTAYHDDFIGLTGTETELQVAYDAFSIEKEFLFDDPEYGPVYAHGSFMYLLDGDGNTLTLIPPVLSDAEIISIIAKYIG